MALDARTRIQRGLYVASFEAFVWHYYGAKIPVVQLWLIG